MSQGTRNALKVKMQKECEENEECEEHEECEECKECEEQQLQIHTRLLDKNAGACNCRIYTCEYQLPPSAAPNLFLSPSSPCPG